MTEEVDIYRTAQLLKELHGEGARSLAQERAEGLIEAGDAEGHLVWKRIIGAIDDLQAKRGKSVH